MTGSPLLTVQNLSVRFDRSASGISGTSGASGTSGGLAVDDVSFEVAPGECFAIVGESGSGKSVTARSLLGLAPPGAQVSFNELSLDGKPLPAPGSRRWRAIRGASIGLVLQDALVSLDPLRPVGREIDDVLRLHTQLNQRERHERVLELLTAVGVPDPGLRARQRSGELSGGLRQRALIAAGIAAGPALIIADEPTTALDVTVQTKVLDLLSSLRDSGTALILITHDLAVVSQVADRVAVMSQGRIVETGYTRTVLSCPSALPTQELLASIPVDVPRGVALSLPGDEIIRMPERPRGEQRTSGRAAPVPALEMVSVSRRFPTITGTPIQALDDVSLTLDPGTTLGLVGQSGSGKTTIARIALGLESADSGNVYLNGNEWGSLSGRDRRPLRHTLGAIYQDALSSFDPRLSVERILIDALNAGVNGKARARAATTGTATSGAGGRVGRTSELRAVFSSTDELLDAVGLPRTIKNRRPLHLSGGQRQRIAIARALAPGPHTILCDEPVSSLDVSTQARVLNLLDDLQRHLELSYLFISHDLGVIRHMSDRVAVINQGRIVETGPTEEIFTTPRDAYTQSLISALPRVRR